MSVIIEVPGCAMGACSACGMCAHVTQPGIRSGGPEAPPEIAAIINEDASATFFTGGKVGVPTIVTYTFSGLAGADFDANNWLRGLKQVWGVTEDWSTFSATQIAAIDLAASVFSAASGLTLVRVQETEHADIVWHYGNLSKIDGMSAAFSPDAQEIGSDIIFNSRYAAWIESQDFSPEGSGFAFLLHEFGHAVGLKHPFFGRHQLLPKFDNRGTTIMSHTQAPDGSYLSNVTNMDRAALQFLYGTPISATPSGRDLQAATVATSLTDRDGTGGLFLNSAQHAESFRPSSDVLGALDAGDLTLSLRGGELVNLGDIRRVDFADGTLFRGGWHTADRINWVIDALLTSSAQIDIVSDSSVVDTAAGFVQALGMLGATSAFTSAFTTRFAALNSQEFVKAITGILFGRSVVPSEVEVMTGSLNQLSRLEFTISIASSEEVLGRLGLNTEGAVWINSETDRFLFDIYNIVFNRPPVDNPFSSIEQYKLGLLGGLPQRTLVEWLINSTEYANIWHSASSNDLFVRTHFAYAFDRAPTNIEADQLLGLLQQGMSRADLLLEIVRSDSYVSRYGIRTADRLDIVWSQGADRLDGTSFGEALNGGAGDDTLLGLGGNDQLSGGEGDDFLVGGVGTDSLEGGGGNDSAIGFVGDDIFRGGAGWDSAFLGTSVFDVRIERANGAVLVSNHTGTLWLDSVEAIEFVDANLTVDPASSAARIYRLYDALLDRKPDPRGLSIWSTSLDRQSSLDYISDSIARSGEFLSRFSIMSDQEFIESLYQRSLNRSADDSGFASWTGALASGLTRGEAALGFSESQEAIAIFAAQTQTGLLHIDYNDVLVRHAYFGILDRAPDPDGLKAWSLFLGTGGSWGAVTKGFFDSAEFQQRSMALTNAAYVEMLYNNILDRPSDADGLISWIAALEIDDSNRLSVINEFFGSQEFTIRVDTLLENFFIGG